MYKIIISGGGTGGHLFPAISIANEIKSRYPDTEILFVGANGRLEMTKVPLAGYKIEGLPVSGFIRSLSFKNIKVIIGLIKSLYLSRKIIKNFKPDLAIGVGGYASGPLLYMAAQNKVPTIIQEQNSYAGITNKILARKAKKICVAYPKMERFFDAEKIVLTGNPIRKNLINLADKKDEAIAHFGLDKDKKTILIVGGSGGARAINEAVIKNFDAIQKHQNINIILQTGKYYFPKVKQELSGKENRNIKILDFIDRMDLAYSAADIIVSRSGAGTISELSLIGKAVILVPSPNVAEDHQTKNAKALVEQEAAIMISDKECADKLLVQINELINNPQKQTQLGEAIKKTAKPNAAKDIVEQIMTLLNEK